MLDAKDYQKFVRRPYPPLYAWMILEGLTSKELNKAFVREGDWIYKNLILVDAHWYYASKEVYEGGQRIYDYWSEPGVFEEKSQMLRDLEKPLIDPASLNFEDFYEAYRAYSVAITIIFTMDKPAETKVRDLLSEKTDEKEVEELMDILNIPLEDNFYKMEEYDLAKTDDMEAHAKKYAWVRSRYGVDNTYTAEQAKANKEAVDSEAFLKEWDENKAKLKKAIARAKELVGEENERFIDFMQYVIYYRTQRTDMLNRSTYYFAPVLEKMGEDRGFSYDEMMHATPDEILGEMPEHAVLQSRIDAYVLDCRDGVISIYDGEDIEKYREMFAQDFSDITEVKGTIASKGEVEGDVVVIKSRADYPLVKEGDLIVTAMTTPEMVSFMKLAAGYITDEGGITCHAAIISRELHKPCIIGTTDATSIFKTGDRVLLDATNGVAKKV